MIRDRSDFPSERLPEWGVDDEGTWFTRDSRRYQRQQAVILTFESGERVGLTPAHAQRFHDLLQQLGVNGD
jgi:hypothetical protein